MNPLQPTPTRPSSTSSAKSPTTGGIPTPSFDRCTTSIRLASAWIDPRCQLKGKRVIDIGCGGGLLSEGMAALGARSPALTCRKRRSASPACTFYESGHTIDYR
jgi:2-polyprenyl-3-methyl-5-hydroxy-6-metoxy-1,4-benzoquinol methylase